MMQTVITWRRPRDAHRNLHYGNPCLFLIGNALCYIISGLILLVIGVIITSLTFQNLEHHDSETSERYAGPILIVVGVLVLARGALNHIRPGDSTNPQRLVIRSYTGEISTRPIMEYSSNSMTMCSVVSIGEGHEYPRLSIYNDDPPSYDAVVETTGDPACISESTTTREESTQSPDEQQELPPSYEECFQAAAAASTPVEVTTTPQETEVVSYKDT
ncbi:uncharacterized protein LOC132557269 [Ylistrum balloti]|uniref:uncharacterized protein LOC132557269 n=1 Tax=Ylistrum balloti TaxID=509963 RepID=UPI002905F184|nr:uncharacterized protein LOC132557269 [Ylistrum balloti]